MAISIDWATKVISVPKADLALVDIGPPEIRSLDTDQFRKDLNALQAGEIGMAFETTHQHTAPVTLGGVTFARQIEIINGYTVTFEAGAYAVNLPGSNNNISDVTNLNSVSVRSSNSAGLAQVDIAASADAAAAVWGLLLDGTFDAGELLKIIAAAAAGKASGLETNTPKYRDLSDTKDVIDAGTDNFGNRDSVTLNP